MLSGFINSQPRPLKGFNAPRCWQGTTSGNKALASLPTETAANKRLGVVMNRVGIEYVKSIIQLRCWVWVIYYEEFPLRLSKTAFSKSSKLPPGSYSKWTKHIDKHPQVKAASEKKRLMANGCWWEWSICKLLGSTPGCREFWAVWYDQASNVSKIPTSNFLSNKHIQVLR